MNYIGWYHEKGDVLRIPKMLQFLRFRGFKPQLQAVKVWSNLERKNWRRRSRKKKQHFLTSNFWALPSNQHGSHMVGSTLIQWQRSKLKITAVVFFFTAPCLVDFFLKFDQTLTSHNYGLKPRNLENYHIFGMLWTSAFSWYHPRQVIPFQNVEKFAFQFLQFLCFLAFSAQSS